MPPYQATFISFKIQHSLFHLLRLPTMLSSIISEVQILDSQSVLLSSYQAILLNYFLGLAFLLEKLDPELLEGSFPVTLFLLSLVLSTEENK